MVLKRERVKECCKKIAVGKATFELEQGEGGNILCSAKSRRYSIYVLR